MIKETILVVIVIRTMKIQNNSKTRHKENKNKKTIIIIKVFISERVITRTTEVVNKITLIKLTYSQTAWKRKKPSLESKTSKVNTQRNIFY